MAFKGGLFKVCGQKLGEQLKQFVANHSKTAVKPYFENLLAEHFPDRKHSVEISEDGEKLRIYYPSVLEKKSGPIFGRQCLDRIWRKKHYRTQ